MLFTIVYYLTNGRIIKASSICFCQDPHCCNYKWSHLHFFLLIMQMYKYFFASTSFINIGYKFTSRKNVFKYLTYNLIFITFKSSLPLPFYGKCRNSRNVSFVFCACTNVVFPVVVVFFYWFSLLLLLSPLLMLLECIVVVFEVIWISLGIIHINMSQNRNRN